MIADKTRQFAPIYERAAEATGVPKAMIAAMGSKVPGSVAGRRRWRSCSPR
ncbi:MAG: hypothetical protein ACYTFT_13995 [Planctomycetota bacterium]|jgi:hypothetical protein